MTSSTARQHASSELVVATALHTPAEDRWCNAEPSTIASAPPRPSDARPLTGWLWSSWLRLWPASTKSPSRQVATSTVGGLTTSFHTGQCNDDGHTRQRGHAAQSCLD